MPIPLGILAVAGAGAAGGGSYELIESTILASETSSVTFSNINTYASTYKHLQIRAVTRITQSAGGFLEIRLNGDSGFNYAYHRLTGFGDLVRSNATTGESVMDLGISANSTTTTEFGASIIDILDFASSSKNTTARAFSGVHSGNNIGVLLASGLWNNTASITSIQLRDSGLNFAIGSRFSLYGIKG